MNQLRAESSTSSYHVLPTSSADLYELSPASSSPSHRRRIITFGSKRQQKEGGHRVQCSPRRWTRLLAALTLFVLFITLLALPRRMNLFRSRVVWVRYYSHEEPVKIVLPFGRKVHVSDVKATAVQAMAFGYDRPLGEVKLLSPHGYQKLWPGEVWDDHMETEARKPIIAVDTGLGKNKKHLISFSLHRLHAWGGMDEMIRKSCGKTKCADQFFVPSFLSLSLSLQNSSTF